MKIELNKKYKSPLLDCEFTVLEIGVTKVKICAYFSNGEPFLNSWLNIDTFKKLYKTVGE